MLYNIENLIAQKHVLTESELSRLHQYLVCKEVKKGEFITREGQTERYVNFIIEGGTRTFYIKDGQEYTVDFKFENQLTGSFSSLFTQTPSKQYVQAIEDTKIYKVSLDALKQIYKISKNIKKFGQQHAEMLFIEKEMHEASLMLDNTNERYLFLTETRKEWVRRVPQYYLASYLNITPETFSRLKRKNTYKALKSA